MCKSFGPISWTYNGGHLPDNSYVDSRQLEDFTYIDTLYVTHFRKDNKGSYECRGYHQEGKDPSNIVKVYAKSMIYLTGMNNSS